MLALSVLSWGCGVQLRDGSLENGTLQGGGGGAGVGSSGQTLQYFYAIESATGTIQPLVLNAFSGTLTFAGLQTAVAPFAVHFSARADGKFAYIAQSGSNAFTGFQLGLDGNPSLISGAPWALGSAGTSSAIGPEGRDLYVASAGGTIYSYTIGSTGAPSAGATYAVGANIDWLKMHPTGKFLYVGAPAAGRIYVYTRDTATGALAPNPPPFFVGPASTTEIVIDPTGASLIASGSGSGLKSYSINSSTGALTPVTTIASATGFTGLAMDGTGTYVYALDAVAAEIRGYSVNVSTGVLTALAIGFPLSVPSANSRAIGVDVTGGLVFIGKSNGTVVGYSVVPATGELAALAGYPMATGLASVDVIGVALPDY